MMCGDHPFRAVRWDRLAVAPVFRQALDVDDDVGAFRQRRDSGDLVITLDLALVTALPPIWAARAAAVATVIPKAAFERLGKICRRYR